MEVTFLSDEKYQSILTRCSNYLRNLKDIFPIDGCEFIKFWDYVSGVRARLEFEQQIADSELKRIEGETYRNLKCSPQKYGLGDKVSEASLKYAIECDPAVVRARELCATTSYRAARIAYLYSSLYGIRDMVSTTNKSVESSIKMERE